eukprot:CAMPEP_0201530250 /NCGR_PEP_ID=MMETSP0161_2-20130828/44133_1 /ASSEMBLY_ACC=CAM_ASM_000251 /TAXON_ID=180227 /ORGANISM="Neoparamoeba aestuarina, Strain SoJaBio B1-5/56/2" /LENGTH=91 /DNA_ID=CAMNT_0047932507 /DNA_START=207 /DNA_END=478 /DNA_ORIENTATION=+
MDVLEPATIEMLEHVGNRRGKLIFEAHLPSGFVKPSSSTPHDRLERIIRAKWEKKEYADKKWREKLSRHALNQQLDAPRPSFTNANNIVRG